LWTACAINDSASTSRATEPIMRRDTAGCPDRSRFAPRRSAKPTESQPTPRGLRDYTGRVPYSRWRRCSQYRRTAGLAQLFHRPPAVHPACALSAVSEMESTFNVRDIFSLPGLLSLSRIVLAACFPFTLDAPWLALATLAAAALSDGLDGYFARRLGMSSPTGAALDPVTDKIFATSVMVSLIARDRMTLGWAALLSLRELLELPLLLWLVATPRARAMRAAHLKANWLGKVTTAVQFIALAVLLLQLPTIRVWMIATAVCGVLAAAVYWASFIKILANGKKSPPLSVSLNAEAEARQ
jgi:phosphatidylglycerophosphate synthase